MVFRYLPSTPHIPLGYENDEFRYGLDDPKDIKFTDEFVCLDIECHSKKHRDIRTVQLFQPSWEKVIILDTNQYSVREIYEAIKHKHLVAHNMAFELSLFQTDLGEPDCVFENINDTFLLSRIAFATEVEGFGFDNIAAHVHGFDYYKAYAKVLGWPDEDVPKFKKAMQKSFLDSPKSNKRDEPLTLEQLTYAMYDVLLMSKVYKEVRYYERDFNYQLDCKTLKTSLLSWKGLPIDHDRVTDLKIKYQKLVDEATDNLPEGLLVNSWVQVRKLFDSTESNDTFLASVENDAERYPDNSGLVEFGVYAKAIRQKRSAIKSVTFLNKYVGERFNGYASPTTITGRLQQDENNLMQIARGLKTSFGFTEEDTRYLVHYDFAALELRMLAVRINETVLLDKFRSGTDLHRYSGSQIYNIPEEEIDDHKRFVGKTANFALLYGAGSSRFAAMALKNAGLYLDEDEAKRIVRAWKKGFPAIKKQHQEAGRMDDDARIGRALNGRIMKPKMYSDYLANPNQSSAADCFKLGLVYLAKNGVVPLVGIHDSYLLEAENFADAERLGQVLYKCALVGWFEGIRNSQDPTLPMPGDISIAKNWGEAEKGNATKVIGTAGTYEDYLTFKEDTINGEL